MPSLKDIRNRIGSVRKTKQITSAMKLVASVKMKRATERALAARPYRDQLEAVLKRVARAAGDEVDEPLLKSRDQVTKILVVVLTSDRGLCGPFNNGLLRNTWDWISTQKAKRGVEVDLRVYGRKGQAFFRRVGQPMVDQVTDYQRTVKMDLVRPLTGAMVGGFVDGDYDEVYIAYNRFVNTVVQRPTWDKVLPLTVDDTASDGGAGGDYRYEPDATEILSELLPLYLQTLVLGAF